MKYDNSSLVGDTTSTLYFQADDNIQRLGELCLHSIAFHSENHLSDTECTTFRS